MYSPEGERIGNLEHVYSDDEKVQPVWLTVTTGFGTTDTRDRRKFVPLVTADISAIGSLLHSAKVFLEGRAANVAADEHPSPEEQR